MGKCCEACVWSRCGATAGPGAGKPRCGVDELDFIVSVDLGRDRLCSAQSAVGRNRCQRAVALLLPSGLSGPNDRLNQRATRGGAGSCSALVPQPARSTRHTRQTKARRRHARPEHRLHRCHIAAEPHELSTHELSQPALVWQNSNNTIIIVSIRDRHETQRSQADGAADRRLRQPHQPGHLGSLRRGRPTRPAPARRALRHRPHQQRVVPGRGRRPGALARWAASSTHCQQLTSGELLVGARCRRPSTCSCPRSRQRRCSWAPSGTCSWRRRCTSACRWRWHRGRTRSPRACSTWPLGCAACWTQASRASCLCRPRCVGR